jgi:ankyrin repeat protein
VECIAGAYKRKRKRDSSNPLRKALEYAAQMKNINVVKYLISEEPNIKSDTSLLYQAAKAGHFELVRLLVEERKADVNEKYDTNTTALHFASRQGHLEIVKYLLERGSDEEAKDTFGHTPLHLAVEGNQYEIVKYLLEKGADPNTRSRDGVNIWRLLGCLTGGCSTIQIEQKLFNGLKSWDVRLRLCSTEN